MVKCQSQWIKVSRSLLAPAARFAHAFLSAKDTQRAKHWVKLLVFNSGVCFTDQSVHRYNSLPFLLYRFVPPTQYFTRTEMCLSGYRNNELWLLFENEVKEQTTTSGWVLLHCILYFPRINEWQLESHKSLCTNSGIASMGDLLGVERGAGDSVSDFLYRSHCSMQDYTTQSIFFCLGLIQSHPELTGCICVRN